MILIFFPDSGDGTVFVYNTLILETGEYEEECGHGFQTDPENFPGELVFGYPERKSEIFVNLF